MRVLTMGTFDLFHVGHVNLLRACWELRWPDAEVHVAVNADGFVAHFKGRAPVVNSSDRIKVVGSCRYVDYVYLNLGYDSQARLIESVDPDIIAVGDDWKDRDYLGQLGVTQDWLDLRGIEVVYLPRTPDVSSSDLRERIASR